MTQKEAPAYPTLKNPPLVEVILEVQVTPNPATTPDILKNLGGLFPGSFGEPSVNVHSKILVVPPTATSPPDAAESHAITGYTFRSQEGHTVVRSNLDGFSFHRLAPYPGWGKTFHDFLGVWEIYRTVAPPLSINNLVHRAINVINFPTESGTFDDTKFFRGHAGYPDIPSITWRGYACRFDFSDDKSAATGFIVTQKLQQTPQNMQQIVMDVFTQKKQDVGVGDSFEADFSAMHDVRNTIFFNWFNDDGLEFLKSY